MHSWVCILCVYCTNERFSDNFFVLLTPVVLTHLILNGMVKIKGQIGLMARCVVDPSPQISDMAKLFFTELATKDNAIYNNLPDMISYFTSEGSSITEQDFRSVMRFLFSFIEKVEAVLKEGFSSSICSSCISSLFRSGKAIGKHCRETFGALSKLPRRMSFASSRLLPCTIVVRV